MTSATRTRTPHVPPATWAAAADFDASRFWAPDIDHSVLITEQRDGVGTARRVRPARSP
ncbi:MAG: hypothetical protein R2697_11005 [Ilumatobacteraceae bacterium]